MTTDRKREQTEVREQNVSSDYLLNETCRCRHTSFKLQINPRADFSYRRSEFGDKPLVEAAILRNFSVR